MWTKKWLTFFWANKATIQNIHVFSVSATKEKKSEHWTRKKWSLRKEMIVGDKNIIHQLYIATEKIILLPLHIKLVPKKQFVRALNQDRTCFQYLCGTFPWMNMEKIKA